MTAPLVRVGAVDIGSNSTNLLIADIDPSTGASTTIERIVSTTRLGAGVDSSRRLADDAMQRTLDVLARYRDLLDRHGVASSRVVASSACRDATNSASFFADVHERTRLVVDLLSGEDEGRLAYGGAMTGLTSDPMGNLVIDIGGGSTEFILGSTDVESSHSIDVGAVRLTDRHLRTDPPRPEDLTNAIGDATDLIDDLVRHVPALTGRRQVVGVAGTIDTIAAVEIGSIAADGESRHGFELTRAAVEDVFRTLATEPLRDRVHNPGLPADRADIIVGGCCVLVAAFRRLNLDSLVVSSRNILDGICAELARTESR